MMKIDITRTALANVLALINTANGLSLLESDVSVNAVTNLAAETEALNTSVQFVTASPGYTGNVTVKYRRLALNRGKLTPNVDFTVADGTTDEQFLTAVVLQLGLVNDGTLEITGAFPTAGQTVEMTLGIKAASADSGLLYFPGSTLTLNVSSAATPPTDLSAAVTVRDLDGFDPADS